MACCDMMRKKKSVKTKTMNKEMDQLSEIKKAVSSAGKVADPNPIVDKACSHRDQDYSSHQ